MSGALTAPDVSPLDISGSAPNPLQKYYDQLAQLHGFTPNALSATLTNPVGTEYATSVGVPRGSYDPVAYVSGGQPVMQSDLDRAHAQVARAMQTAPTMVLGMTGGGEAPLESPGVQALRVYHGTPHLFDPTPTNPLGAFDLSKIGSGEGAQVYGHGIYVAENPATAQSYREALSGPQPSFDFSKIDGRPDVSLGDAQDFIRGEVLDDQQLAHIPDTTLTQAANWVTQMKSQGWTRDDMEAGRIGAPRVLQTPVGKQAISGALDHLEGAEWKSGDGPTVGGEPFNPQDLTHKAAWYVNRVGGDPDAAIEQMDTELAGLMDHPGAEDVGSYHHGAIQRLMQMKNIIDDQRGSLPEYKAPGHTYEAEINADPDAFLHWDKPFSEQSPQVQDALKSLGMAPTSSPTPVWTVTQSGTHRLMVGGMPTGIEMRPSNTAGYWDEYQAGRYTGAVPDSALDAWKAQHANSVKSWGLAPPGAAKATTPGSELYQTLSRQKAGLPAGSASWAGGYGGDPAAASEALREAGIPGIRYLDQGSRSGSGKPTHNYVLFDPGTVNIIKRYGIGALLPVSAGAGALATGGGQQTE